MSNADVARVLGHIATMLEIEGANPFRVRAYREAARIVDSQAESIERLGGEAGALEGIKGIGKDLAQKIRDIATTGSTGLYDELKLKIPVEVVSLTELQGLGPKRVKTLFEVLGIRSRADLAQAASEGKLRALPGFGETIEKNVLKALATAEQYSGRMLLGGAWAAANALAEAVRGVKGVKRVELAGSFRRRRETLGDLDILAVGGDAETVMSTFVKHRDVADVLGRGETKSSVRLRNGLQVDLRLVPEVSFGAALLYFTGSKEHNIALRKIAIDKGWSLNEYGLTEGERVVAGRTEEDVYRALGMAWIPPELREMHGEIELAQAGRLPVLVEPSDLRADLHMHTDRSDGRDTLETMVRACRDRGYEYCAITEHSRSLAMIQGFDTERVRQSIAEMEAVRRKVPGIVVLHGLEVDILADGDLDLDDEGLALLDWVIVSLHARLDQPKDVATARVLRALDHPAVCVMGHPTARHIGSRAGAALDLDAVFRRAAERGVAMEINAQPDRTDLNDINARRARDLGVRFVISTDAHSTVQLDFMRYGLFAARRAGLTKDDVLNTLPYERFAEALARRAQPGRASAPAAAPVPASKPKPPAPKPAPKAARKSAPKAVRKPAPKAARKGGSSRARPR